METNNILAWSAIVSAMAMVVLVGITFWYAYQTKRMAMEMQLAREADLRPYLIIDTVAIGHLFYLVIKNNGKTAAQDIRFAIDKPIETIWKKKIHEIPLFLDGLAFFPPGKEFIVILGPTHMFLGNARDEVKHPVIFTIVSEYSYLGGKHACETTLIDLEKYMDTSSRPSEIVKSIDKLHEDLKKGLDSLARSAERLSKIEALASPSGLDLSQGTMFKISGILNESAKQKIKVNLNLATHSELVEIFEIDPQISEKILEQRERSRFFNSFDELKVIEGMTDELLGKIRIRAFISNPYL